MNPKRRFTAGAAVIAAAAVVVALGALASLERLTYQATTEASLALRARIDELRLSAPMHAVAEMRALSQHAQGLVQDLPEWLVERLLRVTRETTPAARLGLDVNARPEAVRAAAVEGATLCLTYSNGKAPTIRHRATADTLRRSYELMLTNGLARRAAAIPRITERIRSS
jgi:hypothetical protein